MAAVVIWLHGLGDTGAANVEIKKFFTAPYMACVKWLFPTAPTQPVSCNYGAYMPSWFDISEVPVTVQSPSLEDGVLKAVQSIHAMIDREVDAGVSANRIFLCGFSQGGALSLASSMLYPETLAGAAVFSGWVPLNPDFISRISLKAKQTPVLWSHGVSDAVVSFKAGQEGPPLLSRAGVKCEFKAYPGLGHSICAEELEALEKWMGVGLQSSSQ